jgi:L-alanine-DL-glutamate epimerase-like enolase superfamily enzyme
MRAGAPRPVCHARVIALGDDRRGSQRYRRLWEQALLGRSLRGAASGFVGSRPSVPSTVALWDMKGRRAGLSLAKLLGSHRDSVRCYNTSGGFLHTPDRTAAGELTRRRPGKKASAASRSRAANRIARSTSNALKPCAGTWVTISR